VEAEKIGTDDGRRVGRSKRSTGVGQEGEIETLREEDERGGWRRRSRLAGKLE